MRFLLGFVVLLLTLPLHAQDQMRLELLNRSVIYGSIKFESVEFSNKYGNLKFPAKDIVAITFGYRVEPQLQKELERDWQNLRSGVYKERNVANENLMRNFTYSYKFIKDKFNTLKDPEQIDRARKLLQHIEESSNANILSRDDFDTVILKDNSVYKGKLGGDSLIVTTENLGELKIAYYNLKSFHLYGQRKIMIDAAKTPTEKDWIDTGIVLYGNFKLKATGDLDLNPTNPGTHMSGPNGINGRWQGNYLAGQLIGRLGEREFSIGAELNSSSTLPQKLYIRVVQGNFNDVAIGTYTLNVE